MFDDFSVLGPDANAFVCAAKHVLSDGWQTKDLECSMDGYYLIDSRLYVARRGFPSSDPEQTTRYEYRVRSGMFLVLETKLAPVPFTGHLHVYKSCEECDPVLSVGDSPRRDMVWETSPWIEYALGFEEGTFLRCEPWKVQSREDVAKELRARGVNVLSDDDRLAKEHMALRGAR